ncbi:GNAT family N-acetyltransferase [Peribacillus butanolivorans]|uniref:GNAT family N-acetyltransferase n=1 Tax=Peribacillus butanolivorans TaxID=421767 RepID=A0AAX0S429_9BACI|nr:GNAT family N-acetyltransferase [Peribacillus butanolivorans]AXN40008.1 GNAT family N-acetyltransferase [Peribacillus butanolivorans]PEJ33937.1 GNAT family N-acetyltransferase [Peribacillus butanolivorans]QNU06104.1 GNAT family N-acetyltransferase [Peribacillus butanolivorans]
MEIRKLYPDELPPMHLLLLADPSRDLVDAYLEKGMCFVAEIDERIIGVYVLLEIRPELIEIVNIAVVEQLHGRGIGKQLVMHAVHYAKSQGYKTIEIGTGNSGIGQLALYQKCGFRITGVDRDFFIMNYPEVIYENGIQCLDMIRLSQSI